MLHGLLLLIILLLGSLEEYLSEKDFKKEDVGPPAEEKKKFSFNDSVENWANERIKDH